MERWPFLQQTLEEVLGRVTLPCHSKVLGCLLWERSESASIRPLQDPFLAYLLFSSKRRTMWSINRMWSMNWNSINIKGYHHSGFPPLVFNSQVWLSWAELCVENSSTTQTARTTKRLPKERDVGKRTDWVAVPSHLSTLVLEELLVQLLVKCHLDNRSGCSSLVGISQFHGERCWYRAKKKVCVPTVHLALGYMHSFDLN